MSIDIGIVMGSGQGHGLHTANDGRHQSVSVEESLCYHPSQRLWRDDPESAFAGNGLLSAESRFDMDRSLAITSLAVEAPERFISLASHLTPIVQDILLQHYLLGRTYEQIGKLLFPSHSNLCQPVKIGNRLGLRALCAVIKCRGRLEKLPKRGPLAQAWKEMQDWRPRAYRGPVKLRAAHDLGDFVIAPNGQLGELFAASWWSPRGNAQSC